MDNEKAIGYKAKVQDREGNWIHWLGVWPESEFDRLISLAERAVEADGRPVKIYRVTEELCINLEAEDV